MTDPHKVIKECLADFGFGVTIEVTNGLGSEYGTKAKQALRAADFFYHLTNKKAHIVAGLAYLVSKRTMEEDTGLNVILKVDRYSQRRLEATMIKMLDVPSLKQPEANLVQRILERKDAGWPLQGFLGGSQEDLRDHAAYVDLDHAAYMRSLPLIKGFVMELYVGSLFEEKLAEKHIFHRHKFEHKGRNSDADVVVACRKGAFYNVIQRLDMMHDVQATVLTKKTD